MPQAQLPHTHYSTAVLVEAMAQESIRREQLQRATFQAALASLWQARVQR